MELLVVLALLGIMAGLVGLTARVPQPAPAGAGDASSRTVASVQRRAVESGRTVTVVITTERRRVYVTAHPDGRVVGASSLGLDPLAGVSAGDRASSP